VQYHHIEVKTNSPLKPKRFIGTALRGAFGHMLKARVCDQPHYDCDICTAKENCLYNAWFDKTKDDYKPFRFDVDTHANTYDFSLYLFKPCTEELRTIVDVLYDMLHRGVITEEKKLSFPHSEIYLNSQKLDFDRNTGAACAFDPTPLVMDTEQTFQDVAIVLKSPLRLNNSKGAPVSDKPLERILLSIQKRKAFYENRPFAHEDAHRPDATLLANGLKEVQTTRKSNAQSKRITTDALLGRVVVTDLDEESFRLLKWGEIIGVGAKTTLGFGAIKLIY